MAESLQRGDGSAASRRTSSSIAGTPRSAAPLSPPPYPLSVATTTAGTTTSAGKSQQMAPGATTTTTSTAAVTGEDYDEELIPPENFSLICRGVYRSALPKKKNFAFLQKLRLKSVLTLILEDYPEVNMRFLESQGIHLFQFGVPGNKEPFVDIPEDTIRAALSVLMNRRHHPILIHCNKGKHRTGCLVGCLRKLQHWSCTSIFEEYRCFAHPKERSMDQQFIELFDARSVPVDPRTLPDWPELQDS